MIYKFYLQLFHYSPPRSTPPYLKDEKCHIVYLDGPPFYDGTGPVFGSAWNKPIKEARPMMQNSALDLLTAGIKHNVSCVGEGCNYDPPTPPPKALTCSDNPCPTGQDCCKFPGPCALCPSSYTCCATGQKCNNGVCE